MNIIELPQIEPDREKILYAYVTIKSGENPITPTITFPCMLSYILNNNLVDTYSSDLSKLCFIIDNLYDVDSFATVRRLRCHQTN